MTQRITPFDPGHPMVGNVQSWLTTEIFDTPQGQRMAFTLRVPNATVTAVLTKADAENWIRQIRESADRMSSLLVSPLISPFPANGKTG